MESDDDDVRPANPNFQLNLNLTVAHPRPLSDCNRLESASASAGEPQLSLSASSIEFGEWGSLATAPKAKMCAPLFILNTRDDLAGPFDKFRLGKQSTLSQVCV